MKTRIQNRDQLKRTLQQELKKVQRTLKCDLVTLYLYDSERDRIYFPVGIGLMDEDLFSRAVPSRKRLVGKIIRDREPVLAEDALHHPDFTGPFTHLEQIKSGAGFPVFSESQSDLLGFMFINYRQHHIFTKQEVNKITVLSNHIGDLIQATFNSAGGRNLQTSLRKETDLRRKEYRLLELIKQIQKTINDIDIVVWLEKPRERILSVSVSLGADSFFTQETEVSIDDTSNLLVAAYLNARIIEDKSKNICGNIPNISGALSWTRAAAIPIISENHKLGVLCILCRERPKLSPRELDELNTFAKLIAATIRNEDRMIIQSALHDLGIHLVQSHDLVEILNEVVKSAYETIDADVATVHLYDPDNQVYFPVTQAAVYPETAREYMETPRSGGRADIILRKQRIFIEDVDKEKNPGNLSTFIKEQKIKAYIVIPIVKHEQILGVLYVSFKYPRHFSPDELSLVQLLADNAATAISNARLIRDLEIRANALKKLHNVGQELVSISGKPDDLDTVLHRIAVNAKTVLGADLVDLYQYHQGFNEFLPTPIRTGDLYEPDIAKADILADDILHKVIVLDKPRYISNAKRDKILTEPFTVNRADKPGARFVVREKIESLAAIPLDIGKEKVGVMFANFRAPQSFPQQQMELIEIFANQAAIAIHNARVYKESLMRSERLELVREVAAAVSSATNQKSILQLAVDGLARVFNIKQSAVALFDDSGEFSIVEVEYLEPGCISAMGHRIPLKNNPQIDRILETKAPFIVEDAQKDPIMATTRTMMAERNTLSLMIVPIIIDGNVRGTIGVDAVGQKRHFTEEDASLAQAIANQTAVAIRIARQLEERLNDGRALQDIIEQMHQGEFRSVLSLIAEKALELTGAKYSGIWLLNKTHTSLTFGGLAGGTVTEEPPDLPVDEKSEDSINKQVVITGKTYWCPNVKEDHYYKEWYEDTQSELAVPLKYQGKLVGTLNLESIVSNGFTEYHQKLLETLAGQAAIVVQNANLVERLETVDRIGRKLTSGIRLHEDEILNLIYEEASQLMDTNNMYIALHDEVTRTIKFGLIYINGKKVEQPPRKFGEEGIGKTEWIIENKEPLFHATKAESEAWYKQPGHQEFSGNPLAAWIGVPMLIGTRVLGVIATYHPTQEYLYGQDELNILSAMARQAAIAIDNARLYYAVNQDLEALVSLGEEITSTIKLTEKGILEKMYQRVSQLMDTNNMYIALHDDVTRTIKFGLVYINGKKVEQPPRKFGEEGIGKTEWIIENKKPLFHATKAESEAWYKQPGHQEFSGNPLPSWIGVPMLIGTRVLGVIATYHPTQEYLYTDRDLTILAGIARVAAIALENTRLYEETRGEAVAAKQLATLGTAMATLEHRFKNSFNIIIPNINRLRKRVDLTDKEIVEILDIIERNARTTSQIVSRIQKPLQEIEPGTININAVLADAVLKAKEEWHHWSTAPLISVLAEYDDSVPNIWASIGQISEVFYNLVENAFKAVSKGGSIRVSTIFINSTIQIRVQDTGMGIPPDIQQRLITKPVPSKANGKQKGGAGLGLWLSGIVLKSLGGSVTIEKSDASGTTMLVCIPVS